MSTIEELRNIVKRNELGIQAIKKAIHDIDEFEKIVLEQLLSGASDQARDSSTKQRLEQIEVSREDKKALLADQERMANESHAAMEEIINLFRHKVGLPPVPPCEMPSVLSFGQVQENNKNARVQRHPGNVPPTVIGIRSNK